jgi:hypothetical protein
MFSFTNNTYQLVGLCYLFAGRFSEMFRPDLIRHLQEDICMFAAFVSAQLLELSHVINIETVEEY